MGRKRPNHLRIELSIDYSISEIVGACSSELSKLSYVDSIEKLSKVLKPASEGQDANAAVALLLKLVNRDIKVFFVKRVENPADPWSGQMALPGGKRDAKDQNLKQTAIRETLEETNINLHDRCRFLGAIETQRSYEMKILPFVVLLEHEPKIKLNEELEGFFWISLEELVQHKGTVRFSFGEFPAYIVGNSVIWGLTYRIIEMFVHTLGYARAQENARPKTDQKRAPL